MKKAILFYAVFVLSVLNLAALDITTVDGTVYKNVKVTNVLPNTVEFMYTKKDGTYVLRGVKMTRLTKNLQKKFNYSPAAAEKFAKQVAEFQAARNKLSQKYQQENIKLFKQQKKFTKELNHIKALLYAHRIRCWVHIIRQIPPTDCIGKVSMPQSTTKYGHLGSFYIRNLTGPQNIRIGTTIYPTGEVKSFEDGVFPVYDTSLSGLALQIFNEHKNSPDTSLSKTPGKGLVFPVNAEGK